MRALGEGTAEAFRLIFGGDAEVWEILTRTLLVSGSATLVAMAFGIPLGYALARSHFPGRTIALGIVNTGMGMPPVVVGIVVWVMLVRNGPFGDLNLVYTREAMVIAQLLIATPLVIGFTAASVQSLPPSLPELLSSLGAGRLQTLWITCREARLGLLAAVMAGFGAVISEVGASSVVGGNIAGETRVLTTAAVLETSRGNVAGAIALGLILLTLAFAVNIVLTTVQQRPR